MRVGYACICLGQSDLRAQRTTVLRNATPERLRELIYQNLEGLEAILRYNEERDYRLFRLGNEFVPFASHPVNQLRWWEDFDWWLERVGGWIKQHGHRISFHATHFTILNSANPAVVESALADLTYCGRVLEGMRLGPEHKIILHVGTNRPTPAEAMARFEQALDRVPEETRRHLSIENDDRFFSLDQVVPLAHRVGLPVVCDVFHHACLPGAWPDVPCDELLRRAFATWKMEECPPKIHFSSQDPAKKPGAHDYGVDAEELETFLTQSATVAYDFDIMFEAKGKDLAVEAIMPILRRDPRFQNAVRVPISEAA